MPFFHVVRVSCPKHYDNAPSILFTRSVYFCGDQQVTRKQPFSNAYPLVPTSTFCATPRAALANTVHEGRACAVVLLMKRMGRNTKCNDSRIRLTGHARSLNTACARNTTSDEYAGSLCLRSKAPHARGISSLHQCPPEFCTTETSIPKQQSPSRATQTMPAPALGKCG